MPSYFIPPDTEPKSHHPSIYTSASYCKYEQPFGYPIQIRSYDIVTYDIKKTFEYISRQASPEVLNHLGEKLRLFVDSLYAENIDANFMQNFLKDYIDAKNYRTKEEKEFYFQVETLMKASVVYYLLQKNTTILNPVRLYGPSELAQAYPFFQLERCEKKEVTYLMNFCNAMRVAVRIIPPKLKKKLLMAICAKLEGSNKQYITGGCPNPCTERRVAIYEQESGVKPIPRFPRRQQLFPAADSNSDGTMESTPLPNPPPPPPPPAYTPEAEN